MWHERGRRPNSQTKANWSEARKQYELEGCSLEEAIKIQRKAVEAGKGHSRIGEAEATLERFLKAAKKKKKVD